MIAADVMSRPVLTVRANDTVEQAAALLSHKDVTATPVLDAEGNLRLDQYAGGRRHWTVTVHRGVVEIDGHYVDDVEHRVVEAPARTVGGVCDVKRRMARLEL